MLVLFKLLIVTVIVSFFPSQAIASNKTPVKSIEQTITQSSVNVAPAEISNEKANSKQTLFTERNWWQKRNKQQDIFYPHKAHYSVMEQMQDSCMLCHSFNANNFNGTKIHNSKKLKKFTAIINEPMKAVCHSCHIEEKTAPATCSLCHSEKTDIWPADHNINYLQYHGIDAKHNEAKCDQCHISKQFCSDCHFRRQPRSGIFHPLGFLSRHGSEAQFNPSECGTCHNQQYCTDCHRRKNR